MNNNLRAQWGHCKGCKSVILSDRFPWQRAHFEYIQRTCDCPIGVIGVESNPIPHLRYKDCEECGYKALEKSYESL